MRTRTEADTVNGTVARVGFTYDARDRLIREVRTRTYPTPDEVVYDLRYTYDQVGNRLTKSDETDTNAVTLTEYFYDCDPANSLLKDQPPRVAQCRRGGRGEIPRSRRSAGMTEYGRTAVRRVGNPHHKTDGPVTCLAPYREFKQARRGVL